MAVGAERDGGGVRQEGEHAGQKQPRLDEPGLGQTQQAVALAGFDGPGAAPEARVSLQGACPRRGLNQQAQRDQHAESCSWRSSTGHLAPPVLEAAIDRRGATSGGESAVETGDSGRSDHCTWASIRDPAVVSSSVVLRRPGPCRPAPASSSGLTWRDDGVRRCGVRPGPPVRTVCGPASANLTKRFESGNGSCILASHGVPEIPVELKAKPEDRGHPQDTLETEGGIGSYPPLATNNLVEPRERDTQPNGEGGLADL